MVGDAAATLARSSRDRSVGRVDTRPERTGVLTKGQREIMRALTERSKLAHDLVVAFVDRYTAFPTELADGPARQLAAMRSLLARHGVADPTVRRHPGGFTGPGTRTDYRSLLARGRTGVTAALDVTARLASEMIVLLQAALLGLTAPDVRRTYLHMLTDAHHQLRQAQACCARRRP
jgi:hypothetical protein